MSTVREPDQPEPLFDGLLRVGPRLVERSRRQAEFAVVVLHGIRRLGGHRSAPTGHEVPTDPPTSPAAASDRHEPTVLDRVRAPAETPPARTVPDAPGAPRAGADESGPDERDLPIDGYDSLAASQVVPRLATLSPAELRTVQQYEQGHRHRQTILNRVGQLLDGR